MNALPSVDAIDIYLFSNGEQYSPPRKYHLHVDDLKIWNTTLKTLGSSLFGEQHTNIELYTTDGRKLDDPYQLSNKTAYVAVKPPDTFQQTGYEEYLMKATRSWEKRQLKAADNFGIIIRDNSQASSLQNNTVYNRINKTEVNERSKTNNTGSIIGNENKIIDKIKPQIIDNNQLNMRRKPIPVKQMQIKKPSISPQHAKENQSSIVSKTPFSRRKVSIRDQTGSLIDKKMIPSNVKNKNINLNRNKGLPGKSFNTRKNEDFIKEFLSSAILTTFNVVQNKRDKSFPPIQKLYSKQTSSENEIKSIIDREKLLLSEIDEVSYSQALNEADGKHNEPTNGSERGDSQKSLSDIHRQSNNLQKDIEAYKEENIYGNRHENSNERQKPICSCPEVSASLQQIDHVVTVVNNDKIINLRLNIEIKNCDISVTSEQLNNNDKVPSVTNHLKTDKESQVNTEIQTSITTLCKKWNNIPFKTASSRCIKTINDEDNFQAMFIHCVCNNSYIQSLLKSKYLEHDNDQCEKYFLLLPLQQRSELMERCECDKEVFKENSVLQLVQTDTKMNSASESVTEEAIKITSVQKLTSSNTTFVTPISNITQEISKELHIENNFTRLITETDGRLDPKCNIDHRNTNPNLSYDISDCKMLSSVGEQNTRVISHASFVSRPTQTDWCNIMLEARCYEDGRYTFHMPPLEALKKYNL